MHWSHRFGGALAAMAAICLVTTAPARAQIPYECPPNYGDLDLSGPVKDDSPWTVVDVQCLLINVVYLLGGSQGVGPDCYTGPPSGLDLNGDASADVADVLILANLVLGVGLSVEIDSDQDNCADKVQCGLCCDEDVELIDCNDFQPCTVDSCTPATGCSYTPTAPFSPCIVPGCACEGSCFSGLCGAPPADVAAGCCDEPAPAPLCILSGFAGETVDCEIRVARLAGAGLPAPVGLQIELDFDATALAIEGLYAEVCHPVTGCAEVPLVGGTPLQTGHTLLAAPTEIVGWQAWTCSSPIECPSGASCSDGVCSDTGGSGALIVANFGTPDSILADGIIETTPQTLVEGDDQLLTARFTLKETIAEGGLQGVVWGMDWAVATVGSTEGFASIEQWKGNPLLLLR